MQLLIENFKTVILNELIILPFVYKFTTKTDKFFLFIKVFLLGNYFVEICKFFYVFFFTVYKQFFMYL